MSDERLDKELDIAISEMTEQKNALIATLIECGMSDLMASSVADRIGDYVATIGTVAILAAAKKRKSD